MEEEREKKGKDGAWFSRRGGRAKRRGEKAIAAL